MGSMPTFLRAARLQRLVLAALLLCAGLMPTAGLEAAPKTDIIVFQNGDRLTGEVKGLEKGRLDLSTDSAGTVQIEWDKIASIQTNQYLDVETTSGRHFFGKAPEGGTSGNLSVRVEGEPEGHTVAMADVVRIKPIDQGNLIARLDGYLSVGFNYAKANNETQFNLSGGVNSRNEIRKWALDGTTTINSQSEGRSTSMYDVTLSNRRFMQERWFTQATGTVQGNEELNLKIREILGVGFGRYLVQDLHNEWAAYAGLALSRENFQNEASRNSVESLFGTQYSFFQYDSPKRSLDAAIVVFPSLTESGRVRAEADVNSRFEIVKDLFFEVSLYGSYDSQPDQSSPSNSDYGAVTSLGYSF